MAQLAFDFEASSAARRRRALARRVDDAELEQRRRPTLWGEAPDVDVHVRTADEAVCDIRGGEPELALAWLRRVVGSVEPVRARRARIPTAALDRLAWPRPPAQVTLDAAAQAVARALWAQRLGAAPLRVRRRGQRLVASSSRWPAGLGVRDAPWPAIAALHHLGVPLRVDDDAQRLLARRLADAGETVAVAGLAGSAVRIEARQPALVEAMDLPGLAYDGDPGEGRYRLPLLAAEPLLAEPGVEMSDELARAIRRACRPVRPMRGEELSPRFPWTLFGFQAYDAARARRIVETTGGVMLAGTMGTGKTTVALALVDALELWPLLVVAPVAAFSTWDRQLSEMGVGFYLATDPPRVAWERIADGGHDAVVISYDRLHAFVELLEAQGFRGIVADELQRIRTPGSRRSRALRQLASAAPYRLGLTGTPLTNRLDDLLPLGAFLAPDQWRPRASARDLADVYVGDDAAAEVSAHLGTLMVRRKMEQTGVSLPERTPWELRVALSAQQRRAIAELEEEAEAARRAGELGERMHVFARLQRLWQIVSCPQAVGVEGPSPKSDAAVELVEQFSGEGRKTVVFTATLAAWEAVGERLDARGVGWVGVRGATRADERQAAERRFHDDDGVRCFVATLKAAGEALTLSPTATAVVLHDLSYSPTELDQAEARAYRMNTTAPVDVVTLRADQPAQVDDRCLEILAGKRELFARVVDGEDYVDEGTAAPSLEELVYMLTGSRDPDPGGGPGPAGGPDPGGGGDVGEGAAAGG